MGISLKREIKASKLAAMLGCPLDGPDVSISSVATLDESESGSLSFCTGVDFSGVDGALVIASESGSDGTFLIAENPRLTFARALLKIDIEVGFNTSEAAPEIHSSATIGENVSLGKGVSIGEGTVIEDHVVIKPNVTIGKGCYIKSFACIGGEGFGYARDENSVPVKILQLGNVELGDRVNVGSFVSINRATLGTTYIGADTKLDDHVHIGHNCNIGERSIITACTELSGGVVVGNDVWIGPNSSIIQKVKIGSGAYIGIATSVRKNVDRNTKVAGNPMRVIK